MLEIGILGSGSLGNSTVIKNGDECILVDAGFSCQQLTKRLANINISPLQVKGIFISHEHTDHIKGINIFCHKYSIPVYINEQTQQIVKKGITKDINWQIFNTGQTVKINSFKVESFSVLHDAVDPVAYCITSDKETDVKIGVATDCGYINNIFFEKFSDLDALVIESNYDVEKLETDMRRPWVLKQRIASRHGHLSNNQCTDFLHGLIKSNKVINLKNIFLAHLSRDCNTPQLALKTIFKKVAPVLNSVNDKGNLSSSGVLKHRTASYNADISHPYISLDDLSQTRKLNIYATSQNEPLGLFEISKS